MKWNTALLHMPNSSGSAHPLTAQMTEGMAGALLPFRTGSKARAFALINHLKCAYIVSNIGDVRTLVVHPASSIYIHSDREEMEDAGVYEDLIRVSVGIEDIEDLIADFSAAVRAIAELA